MDQPSCPEKNPARMRRFISERSIPAIFLPVALLFHMHFPPPVSGQGQQPLLQAVQTIEQTIGLSSDPRSSVLDRVAALERRVFGQAESGPVLPRLNNLRRTVLGVQSGGAAPSQQYGQPARPQFSQPVPSPSWQPVQGRPFTYPDSPPQSGPPATLPAYRPLQTPPGTATTTQTPTSGDPLAFVNASPPQFVRIDPVDSKLKTKGDYYSSVMKATKGKTLRFKTMPIPVFITPYPDHDFTNSVILGFESWEEQTDGLVRFVQVDNLDNARIRVTWKHLGTSPDDTGCTLGAHTITKWKSRAPGSVALLNVGVVPVPLYIPKFGPKYSVPPQVIEVNLDLIQQRERDIRYQVLQNVVTHELGHALGILGHSPYKNDMMYPITDEHSRLSPRDISTITKIYSAKVDIPL